MKKRTPYSWFAFYFSDFLSDTTRLPTEAVGAYVLLMADYFSSGGPPPDDDKILASITRLSKGAWRRNRPHLQRLFQVEEGYWHHNGFDAGIRETIEKYAAKVRQTEPARQARAAKRGSGELETGSVTEDVSEQGKALKQWQSQTPSHPTNHNHNHTSLSAREKALQEFQLNDEARAIATEAGLSGGEADDELSKFKDHHRSQGRFPADLLAAWRRWMGHAKRYRAKNASTSASVSLADIDLASMERQVILYSKNQSLWSRQMGPEPGHFGSIVPHWMLKKHGIDPSTGLVTAGSLPSGDEK